MTASVTCGGRRIDFPVRTKREGQLACGAADAWIDSPSYVVDPRVIITPRRVELPDSFFSDTLERAGFPLTPTNMRSVYERFGMQFINKARQYIDTTRGQVAGEGFTARYGRPSDDDLAAWPAQILRGWITLEPEIAHVIASLPSMVQDSLLKSTHQDGYFSTPAAPLKMWKSDWYEDGGSGPLRKAQPPTTYA